MVQIDSGFPLLTLPREETQCKQMLETLKEDHS